MQLGSCHVECSEVDVVVGLVIALASDGSGAESWSGRGE